MTRMAAESCPELAHLVQQLAEAMNERKRVETDDSHSTEERMHSDQQISNVLEAVRAHKAEHRCELADDGSNSHSAA